MSMLRRHALALCVATGLEEPRIEVSLGRAEIYQGESVDYQIVVHQARDVSDPDLSSFDQFDVELLREQPFDSSQISIFNGIRREVREYGIQWFYQLTPRSTGNLEIPAPSVVADGKALAGESLRLRVVTPQKQDLVRLDLRASPQEIFPTQSFTLTLTILIHGLPELYSAQDPLSPFREGPELNLPWLTVAEGLRAPGVQDWIGHKMARGDQPGFQIQGVSASSVLSLFGPQSTRFDLDGRPAQESDLAAFADLKGRADRYWVYRLQRIYVGDHVGVYELGAVSFKGPVVISVSRGGNRPDLKEVYAVSEKVAVTVREVPLEGRPETFTGGVGEFDLGAEVSPVKLRVGDPMTLMLTLTGAGNLADVAPPALERIDAFAHNFKIYEATSETKGGRRVFTYSLRPLSEQVEEVPAVPLSFFNVARGEYVTIASRPIAIEVGSATVLDGADIVRADPADRETSIEARAEGLFSNVSDHGLLADQSVEMHAVLGQLLFMALLFCGLTASVVFWQRRHADPLLLRKRSALSRARDSLRAAQGMLAQGKTVEASLLCRGALSGLIADVAAIEEKSLTHKDALTAMVSLGVGEPLTSDVATLIDTLDGARYGGSGQTLQEQCARAAQKLEELGAVLRKGGRL